MYRISFFISWLYGYVRQRQGQSTVEAAALLPIIFMLCALLLQPIILSFSLSVMQRVAAETARVAATDFDGSWKDCQGFALRRLEALPHLDMFHTGDESDWVIEISRDEHEVEVSITGHVTPLPLWKEFLETFHEKDERGLILRAHVKQAYQSSWLGGSYDEWMRIWN